MFWWAQIGSQFSHIDNELEQASMQVVKDFFQREHTVLWLNRIDCQTNLIGPVSFFDLDQIQICHLLADEDWSNQLPRIVPLLAISRKDTVT